MRMMFPGTCFRYNASSRQWPGRKPEHRLRIATSTYIAYLAKPGLSTSAGNPGLALFRSAYNALYHNKQDRLTPPVSCSYQ